MNHAEVKKSLADYLEGDLSLERRALVDAHLDACEECAVEVAELERTILILRSLPEPETPPMIAANVMRRIRTGETEPGFLERLRRRVTSILEPSFMLPATAIAAAAFVFVVVQDPSRFGLEALTAEPRPAPSAGLRASAPLPLTAMSASRFAEDPRPPAARARAEEPMPRFRSRVPVETVGGIFAGAAPPSFLLDAPQGSFTGGSIDLRNRAVPVAAPIAPGMIPVRRDANPEQALDAVHAGGEDPRDAWIALGLERPRDFARFLSGKTLAEQELWVERLADRAESRGLLDELVAALEATADDAGAVLSADFAAEADQLRAAAR